MKIYQMFFDLSAWSHVNESLKNKIGVETKFDVCKIEYLNKKPAIVEKYTILHLNNKLPIIFCVNCLHTNYI